MPTRRLSAALTRRPFFTSTDIESFHTDGFVVKENVLSAHDSEALSEHYHELFAGEFPTGIFPDEWHWREGLSLPEAVREIVNGWKASPVVARVALSPSLGHAAASLMRWSSGTRLAQDDVLWKPPGASGIGFHQDSAYISDQFRPRDDNSVTVWIALEDADETTGTVEYAVGSHRWPRLAANTGTATGTGEQETATSASFHGATGDEANSALRAAVAAGLEPSEVTLRSVTVPKGGAIFHHQDVWHGSRANRHPTRPRRALAVHLLQRDVAFRAAPAPDYIYGRYVLGQGRPDVCDTFFPVTWAPDGSHLRSEASSLLRRSGLIPVAAPVEAKVAGDDDCSTLVPAWTRGQATEEAGKVVNSMVAEWQKNAREREHSE